MDNSPSPKSENWSIKPTLDPKIRKRYLGVLRARQRD